jgi:hypothetical protein
VRRHVNMRLTGRESSSQSRYYKVLGDATVSGQDANE